MNEAPTTITTPQAPPNRVTTTNEPPARLELPSGGERMTIHDAFSALKAQREKQPETPPAPPQRPATPEQPPTPAVDSVETLDAGADTDEAAVEVVEEEGEAEPQGAPLAAPSSYTPEEKQAFAALPQPAQKAALRLEQSRRAAFSREQEAAKTERTRAEGLRGQVEAERQFLLQQVVPLVDSLRQATATEFGDIRTPADVQRMAEVDPARFTRWQARQVAQQLAEHHAARLQEQEARAQSEAATATGHEELAKLPTMIKGWNTPESLKKGMAEVRDYVLQQPGIDQSDLAAFRKASFVNMARKARLYDQALAKRDAATAKPQQTPTPVSAAPSARRVASGQALGGYNKALTELRETGSMDAGLAALRARRGIRQR